MLVGLANLFATSLLLVENTCCNCKLHAMCSLMGDSCLLFLKKKKRKKKRTLKVASLYNFNVHGLCKLKMLHPEPEHFLHGVKQSSKLIPGVTLSSRIEMQLVQGSK